MIVTDILTVSALIYLTLLLYELVSPAPHQTTVCDNAATVPAPRLEGPSAALACRTQGTKNKAPARKSLKAQGTGPHKIDKRCRCRGTGQETAAKSRAEKVQGVPKCAGISCADP